MNPAPATALLQEDPTAPSPSAPEAPPLPDESPVRISVDDAPEDEQEREAAFAGEYVWKGKPLLPYTPSKRGLWERLCALEVPLPVNVELGNLEAYAPQALKLVYLLTHRAEDYAHLRQRPTDFLAEIERWVDETCTHADMPNAVLLALRVHNDALRMIAVPQPSGKSGGRSGN